jgi:hypothetical protein
MRGLRGDCPLAGFLGIRIRLVGRVEVYTIPVAKSGGGVIDKWLVEKQIKTSVPFLICDRNSVSKFFSIAVM